MVSGELVELLTHDDAEVFETHPVDTLVNGWNELDPRDRNSVENFERFGQQDQGDRTPVPHGLAVGTCMALKKRPLVDVQVPFGDADGEVAERVGGDVDTADSEAISLHRRKTSVVPNDVSDQIDHCSSRWVARRLVEPT
jgi:hypothetical protein